MQEHRRDVLAPTGAVAWIAGQGDRAGYWAYEWTEVLSVLADGAVVLSVDRQAEDATGWLRDVTGWVPLGEYLSVAAELEEALHALDVRRRRGVAA